MNKRFKCFLAALCLLTFQSGCLLELLSTAAIEGELQAQTAASGARQMDQAQRMVTELELRQGIDVYRVETGSYPMTLEELVPKYLNAVPVGPDGQPRYDYDSVTGRFSLRQ